jgi:hypothetical protein
MNTKYSTKSTKKALFVDANIVDAVIELALFCHLAQNHTWTETRNLPVRISSKKERNKSLALFLSLRVWR